MRPVWICPVCGAPLERRDRSLACSAHHSFDLARSGYVNLLLPQQKGSRDPGDNAEMVRSRSEFLGQGHYQALSDALNGQVLSLGLPSYTVLDAGCGEGYFLRRLQSALLAGLPPTNVTCLGVDISRAAVQRAAKQGNDLQVAVASTFHLPVITESVDVVLKVMAPGDPAEMRRVLRPGGCYLTVIPGPLHLQGLKRLIYRQTGPNEVDDSSLPGFRLLGEQTVERELHLGDSSAISSLLAMTPYYWNIDAVARQRVTACTALDTPMQFIIRQYAREDYPSDSQVR